MQIKPITSGRRHRVAIDKSVLTRRRRPEKKLTLGHKRSGGRNNCGKMTMRYTGGGHKGKLRIVDYKNKKHNIPGIVKSIEYDPYRTAFIALVHYKDGDKRYIIASDGLKPGDKVLSGSNIMPNKSCTLPLKNIPAGTIIYNIELNPGAGGKLVKSAGVSAQLLSKDDVYATVKLPSGEVRLINIECQASIGTVSNTGHINECLGKAGASRMLGIRPRVRGVAMNPVDHPMGGGEGKSSGGHPRSRKGKPSKGLKTRKRNKYSKKYILVMR